MLTKLLVTTKTLQSALTSLLPMLLTPQALQLH
jgi:hypothetical protein